MEKPLPLSTPFTSIHLFRNHRIDNYMEISMKIWSVSQDLLVGAYMDDCSTDKTCQLNPVFIFGEEQPMGRATYQV